MRVLLLAAAFAALASLGAPGSARAQPRGWGGAGSLSYDARYARYAAADGAAAGDLSDVVDLGVTLRALAGKWALGFAVGFDTHLGAGLSGGFAYDVALSPVGVGIRAGKWAQVGVIAGVGVGGVTDRVPFGVQLPIEAFADFWLSPLFRVHAWGARRYVAVAADRPDELTAGVALRFTRLYERWGVASGNGYYVAVTYDERMGTDALGVAIGYSLHFSAGGR